jgi:hypothetical protein
MLQFYNPKDLLYHLEQKNGFTRLPQSQNNCMKTRAYWKLCFLFEGQGGRCETKLGLPNVSC